jgi:hypothetical protein
MGRDGRSEMARIRHQLSADESDIDKNTPTIICQLYRFPMSHIIYLSLTGVVLESAASVCARTLYNNIYRETSMHVAYFTIYECIL